MSNPRSEIAHLWDYARSLNRRLVQLESHIHVVYPDEARTRKPQFERHPIRQEAPPPAAKEDGFKVLETHDDCPRAWWVIQQLVDDGMEWPEAVHVATWSPDVTEDVVELLRMADEILSRSRNPEAVEWDRKKVALLAKVKERHDV